MTFMQVDLVLDGEGAFCDFQGMRKIIHLGNNSPPMKIAALKAGMKSGRTSVVIGLDIGGGQAVVAETSLRLFLSAADALRARYGEE